MGYPESSRQVRQPSLPRLLDQAEQMGRYHLGGLRLSQRARLEGGVQQK